eukprot:1258247-Rhodomonas_salina.1
MSVTDIAHAGVSFAVAGYNCAFEIVSKFRPVSQNISLFALSLRNNTFCHLRSDFGGCAENFPPLRNNSDQFRGWVDRAIKITRRGGKGPTGRPGPN